MKAGASAEMKKIIQFLASIAFMVIFIVIALDHCHHWSSVPTAVSIAGDALVVLGFFVFKENTYKVNESSVWRLRSKVSLALTPRVGNDEHVAGECFIFFRKTSGRYR